MAHAENRNSVKGSVFAGRVRRLRRDERGNVAMMFGLLILPIFAAAGIAVDMLRASAVRADLFQSADAGVLAAARAIILDDTVSVDEAETVARRYFDGNGGGGGAVTIDTFDFTYEPDLGTYALTITGAIDTALMGVLGRDTLPFEIQTEATARPKGPVEVVMALDNTGSMRGDKLASLKSSAKILANALLADESGWFKVGLAPFGQYVNVGTNNGTADWVDAPTLNDNDTWNGCVGSRNPPLNEDDFVNSLDPAPGIANVTCPQPVFPMTTSKSALVGVIDAMEARGSTYIPGGLVWGRRLLSGKTPFTQGLTYDQISTQKGLKTLILLTDGANTRSATFPEHDDEDPFNADQLTEDLCDAIEADKVRIYTIAFEVDDNDTETLMRECASADGGYFDAENPAQLEAAFSAITVELAQLALSK